MGGVYHITMLVSGEQEDAIRLLFRDKNWPCWVKVLTDEHVANLIQSGFTDVFPTMGENYAIDNSVFTEIKSEIVDVDEIADEHSDNQSLNASRCTMKSSFTDDNEDDNTMDYDMAEDKSDVPDIKSENAQDGDTDVGKARQTRGGKKGVSRTDNRLKCALCDTYCVTRTILRRHCKRRHKGMWLEFECRDCSEKFKTKEELWKHRREANHEPRKVLSSCSKELHTPEELLAMGHIRCEVCSNFYPHKRSLRRHMYKVHREYLPKWTCAVCSAEFDTRDALWLHKRQSQHKTSLWTLGNYQCDSCGKIYNRYDSFREHKLSCKTEGKEAEEAKEFPCDICGLVFKSMLRVKSHKRGVHVVAPVVCHVCGAMCKNKRALLVHRRRHDMKNKKFGCDDCGKTFFNNTLLTQHIRTHTKEKPYKCPICNYRCAIKQNIHKHAQKVHKTAAKAVDLSAGVSKELNPLHDTDPNSMALDLSEDPRNTSIQDTSLVTGPNVQQYDPNPDHSLSELQKYNSGRRDLFGIEKMLLKDEREIQALQSLGALSEGVQDLRSSSTRQQNMDPRRTMEPENLHMPPAHESSKDKYQSSMYESSHLNELQDLRMPSAIRSNDSVLDVSRKNYMLPNLPSHHSGYPAHSDMSFSQRASDMSFSQRASDMSFSQRASETNPYKYNWGASPNK